MAETMPTYYDVLQVERDATPERVRSAYRRLAQKYHPDKLPGNANAARAMAAINAAYEVLSDGHRRAEHDLWIRRAERPTRPALAAADVAPDLWTFMHPSTSWPWYLLVATLLFAVGTILTAVYMTAMPARAAVVSTAQQPCQPSLAAPPHAGCAQR